MINRVDTRGGGTLKKNKRYTLYPFPPSYKWNKTEHQ